MVSSFSIKKNKGDFKYAEYKKTRYKTNGTN